MPTPSSHTCGSFCCRLVLAATSALFLLVPYAPAQDLDDATLGGRVRDTQGAFVPAAVVTAINLSTGFARVARADAEGRYRFIELAPGGYRVRAEAPGFAAAEITEIALPAGRNATYDFALRPAGPAEEQLVLGGNDAAGGVPALDTTRTVVGGTLTRAEIESLPIPSRAPLDLVFTLGGVTEEPLSTRDLAEERGRNPARTPEEAGAFALAGGAAYSNNVTIDGLDNNDDRGARERFQPPLDSIAEVQVVTNQFSAEYGRASGGRINLLTRSGTRDFHGRASYFFRDEALDANSHFNNARGLGRLPLQQHTPGFTLSGPLTPASAGRGATGDRAGDARRRTLFFVAYEYDTTLDSTLIDTLLPVAQNSLFPLPSPTALAGRRFEASATHPNAPAELAPYVARVSTPARGHALTARVDHSFGDAHNATLLYQAGRTRNLRQFAGGSRLAESLQGRTRHTDALALTSNYVFAPRAVNQLRLQVSRLTPALKAQVSGGPVVLIQIDDPFGGGAADPFDRSGTLVAGSSNAGASDRREMRWQLQDALSVLRGAHTLKAGFDLQHVRSTFVDLTDATGTYTFTSAGDFLAGAPARFRQRFNTESAQRNFYAGFFAQQEWRAHTRLTVTLGARYERETIVADTNNWSPRVGVAYDPFGSGRTVLRFGAGVFYNRALLRTVDDFSLGRSRLVFDTNALRDAATRRVLTDAQRRAFIAANLSFPVSLAAGSALVQQFGAAQTDFTRRLDPALRIPESYQLNAGFERELGAAFVFEANYTYNRSARLWREFNANAPRLPAGFKSFADYLLSRDFANLRDAAGTRPLYDASAAGELVRFSLAPHDAANPDAIARLVEFGVPVTLFNLNSVGSTTALNAARAALDDLRPDPTRGEVEQLVSAGNSFYHGLTLELRRRFAPFAGGGAGLSLRAAYTLSRLIDDGVVNTSDALRPGDFRAERARSLLDRRHRFVVSGVFDLPRLLGRLRLAPVFRLGSGAPFNISLGGVDRNLDDVS
ncbi:MAG: TonB-dependent receptor domain-containing protein, partial [Pyrinomonadaceae bacterium]